MTEQLLLLKISLFNFSPSQGGNERVTLHSKPFVTSSILVYSVRSISSVVEQRKCILSPFPLIVGGNVFHLTGWSDKILQFIGYAEKGISMIDYIESIEL